MKRFASVLAAVLFTMLLAAPVFATDFVPSVARPNPVVVNELPDPNDPDAPDFVTVEDENGEEEPQNFVRVEDPESEDPEDPDYTYVPEDEVPLAPGVDDANVGAVADAPAVEESGSVSTTKAVAVGAVVAVVAAGAGVGIGIAVASKTGAAAAAKVAAGKAAGDAGAAAGKNGPSDK